MKLQPTKDEWNYLTEKQQLQFWIKFKRDGEQLSITRTGELKIPNIGEMIWFLGDYYIKSVIKDVPNSELQYTPSKYICDKLFGTVKYILSR